MYRYLVPPIVPASRYFAGGLGPPASVARRRPLGRSVDRADARGFVVTAYYFYYSILGTSYVPYKYDT